MSHQVIGAVLFACAAARSLQNKEAKKLGKMRKKYLFIGGFLLRESARAISGS
jgi:hypothetical protein